MVIQLGAILEEILAPEQYDTNVATIPGSTQRVEYAIRMTAAHPNQVIQLFVGLAQTLLHLGKPLPELVKLGLYRTQQLPHLAGTLLDGKAENGEEL